MARVFVSYRRADGTYGVGWLAERLRSLDTITGVETAFHDAALRAGDDFHAALDDEIAGSDLLIAVIGPEWLGERSGTMARIRDSDDWVVREIAAAFQQGTRVLPILIGGAEHPLASQMHDSIGGLARLHALPFADGRDLDEIVEHVESHLTEIDRDRAQLAGLEERVVVPRLDHLPWVVAAATLGAAIGGVAGWVLASYRACSAGQSCGFQGTTAYDVYEIISPLMGAAVGASGVVGIVLARRLHRVATHRWWPIVGTTALVGAMLLVLSLSSRSGHYAITEAASMSNAGWRTAGKMALVAFGSTMTAGILSGVFGTARAQDHLVADRVRTLGIMRDAARWGAIVVSIEFSVVSLEGAAILAALEQTNAAGEVGALPNIAFALTASVVLILLHHSATARLDDEQARIERALANLPPQYQANATPRLMAPALEDDGWLFRAILALPLIVTVAAALVDTFS